MDASAIVPLLVAEPMTARTQALSMHDPDMLVWWGSEIGCASALGRLERTAALDGKAVESAFDRLRQLADHWHEIEPSEIVRESAMRFLRVHALSAADAFQSAAAFTAAEYRPASLEFVAFDDHLANAARKEGFPIVDMTAN